MGARGEKREEKRREIFEAATGLMKTRGFSDITVKDICEAAGISNGTFFYYFETKQSLLDYYLGELYDEYLEQHGPKDVEEGDFVAQIVELYRCYMDYCKSAGVDFISCYYTTDNKVLDTHEFSGTNTLNTTMMRDLSYLVEAQKNGFLLDSADPIAITLDCCTIVKGVVFEWCVASGSFDPFDYVERILTVFLRAYVSDDYKRFF